MSDWTVAERIADKVLEVLNSELTLMRANGKVDPAQLLAGCLVAFLSYEQRLPPEIKRPPTLEQFMLWAHRTLEELMEVGDRRTRKDKM